MYSAAHCSSHLRHNELYDHSIISKQFVSNIRDKSHFMYLEMVVNVWKLIKHIESTCLQLQRIANENHYIAYQVGSIPFVSSTLVS